MKEKKVIGSGWMTAHFIGSFTAYSIIFIVVSIIAITIMSVFINSNMELSRWVVNNQNLWGVLTFIIAQGLNVLTMFLAIKSAFKKRTIKQENVGKLIRNITVIFAVTGVFVIGILITASLLDSEKINWFDNIKTILPSLAIEFAMLFSYVKKYAYKNAIASEKKEEIVASVENVNSTPTVNEYIKKETILQEKEQKLAKDKSGILIIFVVALLAMVLVLGIISINKYSSKNEVKEPNNNQVENNNNNNNNNQSQQKSELKSITLHEWNTDLKEYTVDTTDFNKMNKIVAILSNKKETQQAGGLGGAWIPYLELQYSDKTVEYHFYYTNFFGEPSTRTFYNIEYNGDAFADIKSILEDTGDISLATVEYLHKIAFKYNKWNNFLDKDFQRVIYDNDVVEAFKLLLTNRDERDDPSVCNTDQETQLINEWIITNEDLECNDYEFVKYSTLMEYSKKIFGKEYNFRNITELTKGKYQYSAKLDLFVFTNVFPLDQYHAVSYYDYNDDMVSISSYDKFYNRSYVAKFKIVNGNYYLYSVERK